MTRFISKTLLIASLLFLLCSLVWPQTPTKTTVYVYDELGRLKAVITPSGDSAIYNYDAAGNIVSITRQTAATVSIIEFTPDQGAAGSSVTIYGTGFSLTPAQNNVSFNGVAATVSAASATQLIVTVPAGATTGPIAVTTPTGSATSTTSFEVLQSLAITGFTPAIGTPGTAVQITGTDFDPVAANDQLKFNITTATAGSATSTTIDTTVPTGATSGHLSVTTGAGTAVSSADFFVPPSPFTAASVDFTGRIAMGETKALAVNAANHIALVVFDGTAGQRIALQATNSTISSSTVRVIKPDNTNLLNPTSLNGNWFVDTLTLPVTGTYTIVVDPNSTFTGTMNLTLHNVPSDVTGTITAGGAPVTVTTTTPGQNASLSFTGTTGQRISLDLTSVTLASSAVTVKKPDGTTLFSAANVGTAGTFFDAVTLPATGTYTILIDPALAATGSMTLTLYDIPANVTGTIVIGGADVSVTINTPGQNAQLTFTGTAGQIVSLDWNGTIGYGIPPYIVNPDGTTLSASFWYEANGYRLPVTGTYTIAIDPFGSDTGQTTFTLFEIPAPVTTNIVADGPPVRITIPNQSQMANVTFSGTAGQRVSLRISDIDTGPYPNWSTVEIVEPDGSYLMDEFAYPEGFFDSGFLDKDRLIDTLTLPVTGTYTINVYPEFTSGSYTLTLFNVPADVTANIAADGVAVSATTTVPGQDAIFAFSGTAGQRISLKSTESVFPYSDIGIYSPTGTRIQGFPGINGEIGFEDTLTLSTTGTYHIFVDNFYAFAGTTTLQLFTVPAQTNVGTLTFNGSPVTYTTTVPGQDVDMTFSGTAGQRIGLKVIAPFGTDFDLRSPSNQLLASKFAHQLGNVYGDLFETLILPSTGTYKLTLNTWFTPGDISVTLYDVPADIDDGTISIGGSAVTVTSTAVRQNRRLTFSGTQGQSLYLIINNDTSLFNHEFVNQPTGFLLTRRLADNAAVKILFLGTLPATGTYTILTELYGLNDSVTLSLREGSGDVTGVIVADGQPTVVTVPAARQRATYTFQGVTGQRMTLKSSDVTFGSGTVSMSGTEVDCCDQGFVGDGVTPERFNVRDLTTTGTQSVVVAPNFDFTGSVTLRLLPAPADLTGSVTTNGSPVTVTTAAGQNASYTLPAVAGQQITIHFTNNSTGRIYVEIVKPNGSSQSFHVNSASSFDTPAFIVPNPGTYTIRINPYRTNAGSVTFSVTSP